MEFGTENALCTRKQAILRTIPSSGMLRCVDLAKADISEESIASIIRMRRIHKLGTLEVTGRLNQIVRDGGDIFL
jgi:hypothetical protein